VNGWVDEHLRALLRVPVSASRDGTRTEIVAWVDTTFNGGLTIPCQQISQLGLIQKQSSEAILADGRTVELGMFACFIDWFGKCYKTRVAASDAQYALLGTMLLNGRRLEVDYQARTVELR
jgi:clan AA aspartic protease